MRKVSITLTDKEFTLLEKNRNGIPKQIFCKKKIFDDSLNEADFVSEQPMDFEKPEFYFYVQFKLSPKERGILDDLKGDMTLQEYCKKAVLNKKIINLNELDQVRYQLSKIGSNVNQIARVGNQTGSIDKIYIDSIVEEFRMVTGKFENMNRILKERLD